MDIFTKFFKTPFGRIFITIYIVVIIFIFGSYIFRLNGKRDIDRLEHSINQIKLENELIQSNQRADSILTQLHQTLNQSEYFGNLSKDNSSFNMNLALKIQTQIDSLSYQVKQMNAITLSLRQAINPINPDEILTIVRLKDEIITIKLEQQSFEKRIEDKIQNLSLTILDKANNSDKTTNLIILILAPILLNFIYTIWKDYKTDKKSKKDEE